MHNFDHIHPVEYPQQPPEVVTRVVGERTMRATVIPPEDPVIVKVRDGIEADYIGNRRMVRLSTHGNVPGASHARQAPKYIGETPGFHNG